MFIDNETCTFMIMFIFCCYWLLGGVWSVTTVTGEDPDACPGANNTVCVVLCGDRGESRPVPLVPDDKEASPFQSGETDKFQVRRVWKAPQHYMLCYLGI